MNLKLRKFNKFVDKTLNEGGKEAKEPVLLVSVAAVFESPWKDMGFVEDLKPIILDLAPKLGNIFRDAVGGTSYLSFTNIRGPAGSKLSIPMMHKTDAGLRPYYLTHEFTIHDAPFENEIVIAIGGASSGRAHARTGDRYQDMKEMGIEPK